jgi:hypothetical protein
MHRTGTALGNPTAELGARHPEDVTQNPKKWCVAIDFNLMRRPVDFDGEGHGYLSEWQMNGTPFTPDRSRTRSVAQPAVKLDA